MGATIWYYAKDNQQQGPISEDELRLMFTLAQLPPETLVWSAGMSNWASAAEIQVFMEAIQARAAAVPPPLPPMPTPAQPMQAAAQPMQAAAQPAADASAFSGDMNFENKFSWEQSAQPAYEPSPQDSNGAGKWGDLDAIPTPGGSNTAPAANTGARTGTKKLWDRSSANSSAGSASPNTGAQSNAAAINNPFEKAALDAINNPFDKSAPEPFNNPFDKSALDAIPTPGTTGGADDSAQPTYDLSALESIPTPSTSSASGIDLAALDAIPTPKTSEPHARPQSGLGSLRPDPASTSAASLIRGNSETGSHQRGPKPSLSDLRQSNSLRKPGVQRQDEAQQPQQEQPPDQDQNVVNKLRSGLMKFLGKQEEE